MGADRSALVMGNTPYNLHDRYPSITKERADAYAVRSQEKVAKAYADGKIQPDLVEVVVRSLEQGYGLATKDEPPRPGTTMESLAGLKTPFRAHGNVTPGNAAGLNDGATGAILAAEEVAEELGLDAKMRLVDFSFTGVEPEVMGVGPVPATEKLFARQGITIDDVGLIEINEAFAAQVLACSRSMGLADDDPRLNPNGGAIALGHPLGATGARLVLTAVHELERRKARYALATMCIGVGQGIAVILERV
jgi:acetyl-CoA acyltransferase